MYHKIAFLADVVASVLGVLTMMISDNGLRINKFKF